LTFEWLCLYIYIFCDYMNIEAHYLKYDSRHLFLAHIRSYMYMCVCVCSRPSVSFCLSFLFSISIDAIAQNGEREREFDDVCSMASRAYIEREKKKAQKSVKKREREKERTLPVFFSSFLFYSLSLSSANCMYKQ
jgi:hypothetical protein